MRMSFRPRLGSLRNLSPKTIAKIAAWPIAAFAVTYAFCILLNLSRKLETALFIAAIFLILGIKHTKNEKRTEKSKTSAEGESFFTKPWTPASK